MIMRPRDYQEPIPSIVFDVMHQNPLAIACFEMCVGSGKSFVIADTCAQALRRWPGTRVLVLVPSRELVEQNLQKMLAVWPEAPVGVMSASLGRKDFGKCITIGTVGTIIRRVYDLGRIDLIMIDECDLVPNDEVGMYRELISSVRKFSPDVRICGWTGTPFRSTKAEWLTEGDNALFTHIKRLVTMKEMLERGYLSPLVPAETATKIDTSEIRLTGGEFVVSELAKASDQDDVVRSACNEIIALAGNRKMWLIFGVTVEHCEHIAQYLLARGVKCAVVSGKTPKAERAKIIADFRAGKYRALVSVAVLTVGFDVPEVDCLCLLRATNSPRLLIQICGRGMRIAPGKTDCLMLDFTGTIEKLGPIDEIKGKARQAKGKGEAPFKICENCGNPNPTAATECVECGHAFPPPERIKHTDRASSAAVLSSQKPAFEIIEVTDVVYKPHHKDGSPDSIRVDYKSGFLTVASEWTTPSHQGFPRKKFEQWWATRQLIDAIPGSTAEALEWLDYDSGILRKPVAIVTMKEGKYRRVCSYHWTKQDGQHTETGESIAAAA